MLLIRKDIDVYEHERLSNITLRHKLKLRNMKDYQTLHLDTN
jgi:hypothetical protein